MLSSAGDHRGPPDPRRRAPGVHRDDDRRVHRAPGRREGRRGGAAAVGPRADLGGVRGRPDVRHVPLLGDGAYGPGRQRLPAAAVSAVTVLPTHRRRGILRAMVAAEHGAIRERGRGVRPALRIRIPDLRPVRLRARLREASWTLDTRGTGFHGAPSGRRRDRQAGRGRRGCDEERLRGVAPAPAGRDLPARLPLGIRPRRSASPPGARPGRVSSSSIAIASGAVDGYARYHVDDKWEQRQPRNIRQRRRPSCPHGRRLRVALAVPRRASTGRRRSRPSAAVPSERLPWLLTNARAPRSPTSGTAIGSASSTCRGRSRPGPTSAKAGSSSTSSTARPSGGRIRRRASRPARRARPAPETDEPPDLTLDVSALSAAYLGGVSLRDGRARDAVEEHRAGRPGRGRRAVADARRTLVVDVLLVVGRLVAAVRAARGPRRPRSGPGMAAISAATALARSLNELSASSRVIGRRDRGVVRPRPAPVPDRRPPGGRPRH